MSEAAEVQKAPDLKIVAGRSPAYPYISLEKAIDRADQIKAAGAVRQALPPEAVYKIWKIGAQSSSARQTMAALNHFGLVDYLGRGDDRKVKLSDLALRIVLDKQPDSIDRKAAVRTAALNPPIHKEIYDDYPGFLPDDVVLETLLTRDHGYNEQAAKSLIDELKDTLRYAGLDKPENTSGDGEKPTASGASSQQFEVGDLVNVEINGALQFSQPKRVRALQEFEGQSWVFVEGSETGVPMSQVQLAHKASLEGLDVPPKLPEQPLRQEAISPGEREWLRGPLSKKVSYRLIVSGDIGAREVGKLINVLEAQKAVLADDDEDAGPTSAS